MKWIVFLDVNPGFRRAFEAANELGFKVLLISTGSAKASPAERSAGVERLSVDSVRSVLERMPEIADIAAFFTFKDALVPLANRLTTRLSREARPYPESLVRVTKNKYFMRQALEGTPYNPEYRLLAENDTRPFEGRAIVIKPTLGYSSLGVEKVLPYDDYAAALTRSRSVVESVRLSTELDDGLLGEADMTGLLAESYVGGEEFSAEVFANSSGIRCLGVCGKSEMRPPYFEEISYCVPAPIRPEQRTRVAESACQIMERLGLKSGAAHVELKLEGDSVCVLDIGLRIGGAGLTHDLISAATGIDLVKAAIAELVGLDSDPYLKQNAENIGLLYLMQIEKGGIVKALPTIDETVSNHELTSEFIRAEYFVKPGDRLVGYPSHSGLPGYIIYRIRGRGQESYLRAAELLRKSGRAFEIGFEPG